MKKSIMSKRGRRFEGGGEVEDKAAGLEASNKEAPMGFFERLRAGNIDDPNSEAYKRLGAGRGRAEHIPVEDVTPTPKINNKSEGMDAFKQRLQASKDAEQPDRNKTYQSGLPSFLSGSAAVHSNPNLRQSATEEMLNPEDLGRENEEKKFDVYAPSDAGSSLGRLSPYTKKKKTAPNPKNPVKTEHDSTAGEAKDKKTQEAADEQGDRPKAKVESIMKKKPVATASTFDAYGLNNFAKSKVEEEKPKSTYKKNATYSPSGKKAGTSKSTKENDVDFGGTGLGMKRGGSVASSRADGIAKRGKTRGVMR